MKITSVGHVRCQTMIVPMVRSDRGRAEPVDDRQVGADQTGQRVATDAAKPAHEVHTTKAFNLPPPPSACRHSLRSPQRRCVGLLTSPFCRLIRRPIRQDVIYMYIWRFIKGVNFYQSESRDSLGQVAVRLARRRVNDGRRKARQAKKGPAKKHEYFHIFIPMRRCWHCGRESRVTEAKNEH